MFLVMPLTRASIASTQRATDSAGKPCRRGSWGLPGPSGTVLIALGATALLTLSAGCIVLYDAHKLITFSPGIMACRFLPGRRLSSGGGSDRPVELVLAGYVVGLLPRESAAGRFSLPVSLLTLPIPWRSLSPDADLRASFLRCSLCARLCPVDVLSRTSTFAALWPACWQGSSGDLLPPPSARSGWCSCSAGARWLPAVHSGDLSLFGNKTGTSLPAHLPAPPG